MATSYERAIAAFDARRFEDAEHFFARAVLEEPRRARIFANHARCLVRLRRPEPALQVAYHAVSLDPHDGYLLLALVEVLSALDQGGELLAVAARAPELTPDSVRWLAEGLVEHAWKLVERECCQEAEDVASAAIEIHPTAGAYAVLAGALAERNRWGDARHAIDEALRLSVDDGEVADLERRGALIDKGLASLWEAVTELDARIAAEPPRADLWMEKGDHLHAMGRFDEAARAHHAGAELASAPEARAAAPAKGARKRAPVAARAPRKPSTTGSSGVASQKKNARSRATKPATKASPKKSRRPL